VRAGVDGAGGGFGSRRVLTGFVAVSAEQSIRARQPRQLVLGAAGFTVVAWASAFVAIRTAGKAFSPGPLSLLRLTVAALCLGAAVAIRRERLPSRSELTGVLVCGISWFGIYNLALNAGERRVDAGTAAMIVYIGPVLIALLAGWLLGEGFPRILLLGCAVSFAGVVLIAVAVSDGFHFGSGVLLCLLAAVTYAIGVVAQKPVLARRSSLSITFAACVVGLMVCTPFAPQLVHEVGHAPASAIAWSVYLGVVPTALAFTTWAYALSRTTAGRMASASFLVPPLAVLLGWIILGETPAPLAVVGGVVVLGGVTLAQRRAPLRRAKDR
jgi:drug/metabolite transporter (DMT)-like permease